MLLQADYLQSLCQIIPFFSLPSLYLCTHGAFSYICLCLYYSIPLFCEFSPLTLHMRNSEKCQSRGSWSLKLIKISVRKSTFKMYQVLRVGDCLRQSLLVTYILRFCTEGTNTGEEKQERGGRDRPLLHKLLTEDQLGVGRVEHLDLNQIWSFDYYRDV